MEEVAGSGNLVALKEVPEASLGFCGFWRKFLELLNDFQRGGYCVLKKVPLGFRGLRGTCRRLKVF